jgi:hypothetical protein
MRLRALAMVPALMIVIALSWAEKVRSAYFEYTLCVPVANMQTNQCLYYEDLPALTWDSTNNMDGCFTDDTGDPPYTCFTYDQYGDVARCSGQAPYENGACIASATSYRIDWACEMTNNYILCGHKVWYRCTYDAVSDACIAGAVTFPSDEDCWVLDCVEHGS